MLTSQRLLKFNIVLLPENLTLLEMMAGRDLNDEPFCHALEYHVLVSKGFKLCQ